MLLTILGMTIGWAALAAVATVAFVSLLVRVLRAIDLAIRDDDTDSGDGGGGGGGGAPPRRKPPEDGGGGGVARCPAPKAQPLSYVGPADA